MTTTQWIVFLAISFGILFAVYFNSKRNARIKIDNMLKTRWGKKPTREYRPEDYECISHYFYNKIDELDNVVDDITWNDLDMDRIFKLINNTNSSVGQEYLYKMLRTPEKSLDNLKETDRLANFFNGNQGIRTKIQKIFVKLGFSKSISISDYIELIVELKPKNNLIHYLMMVLLVAAFVICAFINPQIGILAIVAAFGVTIVSYYRYKAEVEPYFICLKHIVRMVNAGTDIAQMNIPELSQYNEACKEMGKSFSKVVKHSAFLSSGSNVNGSLVDIFMDYVKMLTHIDLIMFNKMTYLLNNRKDDVYKLIDILGKIESTIAIASFRNQLQYWSIPELSSGLSKGVDAKEIYHPLLENPVVNSITENHSVLLTGSNASGKSTFLKTIAINAILSQTIYTSISKYYRAPFFRIYSSMSLKDDINNSESYYIVEIKALKRIVDSINASDVPVLCFVDEVLRGTNTVERIAASSQILKSLCNRNVLCFAATHDIELTYILEKYYSNYHFKEDVSNNDILFNYQLFKGRATSRNAIKLLGIIGYGEDIIKASEASAKNFTNTGVWKTEM